MKEVAERVDGVDGPSGSGDSLSLLSKATPKLPLAAGIAHRNKPLAMLSKSLTWTVWTALAVLILVPLTTAFTLFTPADITAFKLPTLCSTALQTPINCPKSYIFGNTTALHSNPTSHSSFCNPTGECQVSIQSWVDAVSFGCDAETALGPTMNVGTLAGRVASAGAIECLREGETSGEYCINRIRSDLTSLDADEHIFEALGAGVVCSRCWLGVMYMRMPFDVAAQQTLFTLRTTICGEETVANIMGNITYEHPYMPYVHADASSMTFDASPPSPENNQADVDDLQNVDPTHRKVLKPVPPELAATSKPVSVGRAVNTAIWTTVQLNSEYVVPLWSMMTPNVAGLPGPNFSAHPAHVVPPPGNALHPPLPAETDVKKILVDDAGTQFSGNWTETPVNRTITAGCGDGRDGSIIADCLADGSWGNVRGSCESGIATCLPSSGWPATLAGQTASQPCSNGFTGTMTALCNQFGEWNPPNTSGCTRTGCQAQGGFPVTPLGNTASVSCGEQYLSGSMTARCGTDGVWGTVNMAACVPLVTTTSIPSGGIPISGTPTSSATATPGNGRTCGGGSRGNGLCPLDGLCCSQHGYCGTGTEYCSVTATRITGTVTTTRTSTTTSVSNGGTCGGGVTGNGLCPQAGMCCSQHGYCGTGSEYCSVTATRVTASPARTSTTTRTATTTTRAATGTCGNGSRGNGICPHKSSLRKTSLPNVGPKPAESNVQTSNVALNMDTVDTPQNTATPNVKATAMPRRRLHSVVLSLLLVLSIASWVVVGKRVFADMEKTTVELDVRRTAMRDLSGCCSEFGFCGLTDDFCGKGCQSNCAKLSKFQPPSSCPSEPMTKVIGYYSNWAHNRGDKLPNCGNILTKMVPEDINPHAFTHLHYAFGFVTHDFHLGNSIPEDPQLIPRFNALKKKNPNLKTLWSIGGWAFNDPFLGTQTLFSDMVTSPSNRATFIKDILFRIPHLGFDGIDLDWEYPGTERYGRETDKENYVVFLKELREAITKSNLKIIVTITAPASYWYLQQFKIDECQKYLDWINVMTYDIHGSWDKKFNTGVRPHTDMLEVEEAVQLFIKAGVRRENLLLGIAFYGRTFTLEDPSCTKYGCLFSGPGNKGPCTDAEGFLSYPEIEHLRRNTGAKVFHNSTSQTVEVHLGNQWISYETPKTIAAKIAFGKKQCLNGVLIWAVDLDPSGELLLAIGGQSSTTILDAEYCPRSGDWETTKRGSIVKIPCPLGEGEITRTCGKDGKWGDVKSKCDDIESEFFKADFSNCKNGPTKDAFAEAKTSPLRRKRELLENIAVDPIHDLWDLMKYTSGDLPNVI
ncbi:hypothetical protein HK097_008908, partial [Rhizophlyctis rosea]